MKISLVPIRRTVATALLISLSWLSPVEADESPEGLRFFESKIRPVLVAQCYACHSSEAAKQGKLRGQLLLDSREATRQGGESGPAIVPGQPDESLLLSAIRHDSFEMPPKGKLPDSVIADFAKWIEMGAPDPREAGEPVVTSRQIDIEAGREFWSFQPLAHILPPDVADRAEWSLNEIDAFILKRQEDVGVRPNQIAEPRILVRRAWFDLLGLPPTPEEIREWTKRLSSGTTKQGLNRQVWSELLDHLLASEHYGERWARHWMDVARFAESHGYEQDYDRPHAYHYRDFLIKAFNKDLPFDQFVQWQLAGDERAPDDPLAWMATGFLGGGAFPTQLTEAEFESARYDELDDMVSTTGVAFLGLSLGCARCHDHKFDPIPSEDYYRMAATFTTVIRSEKEFDLIPEKNLERRQQFQDRLTQLTHELQTFEKEILPGKFRDWLARSMTDPQLLSDWDILSGTVTTSAGTKFQQLDDGSFLAQGQAPSQEVVTFTAETQRTGIVAFRLEALTHESLPHKGPGRAGNGNFALGNITITVAPVSGGDAKAVKLVAARATHQQNDGALSVAASIDDDPISGWAVDGQIGQDQAAVFVAEHPLEIDTKSRLTITLTFNHPNGQHQVGRFRFSVGNDASAEPQGEGGGPGPAVREALAKLTADSEGAGEAWQTAIDWYKTTLPEWQAAHQAVEEYQEKGPGIELTKVLVATEGLPHLPHHADGRGFPHFYPETYLLRRGDVEQKDRIVEQGFVQVLMRDDRRSPDWAVSPPESWDRTSFRRTGLANWMTDVDHGAGALAARVMANRLWQHHFGRGIVSTPNDFGASGEPPTHPDLLEWLAGNLISHDWKLKPVHKLIMSSSTYLQSNDFDERRAERDRENLTYWRREPLRLEAEAIRDSMLSVAGELDRTMFGPGTLDQNMKRRSVYFFIKRSQLIPMMMLFDWPEHLVSIGQRATTTIAPQALMFMNSPQGRQYAQAFAGRLPTDDPPAAVEMAYQIAFGRPPSTTEKSLSLEFLEAQRKLHDAEGGAGPSRLALTDLCQTLMSMNEFVYVE